MEEDKQKYSRCWICDSLVLKKRIEDHHILGKEFSEDKRSLCIICHDLIDRMPMNEELIFSGFWINVMKELDALPENNKWIKLFLLKTGKMVRWQMDREGFVSNPDIKTKTPQRETN